MKAGEAWGYIFPTCFVETWVSFGGAEQARNWLTCSGGGAEPVCTITEEEQKSYFLMQISRLIILFGGKVTENCSFGGAKATPALLKICPTALEFRITSSIYCRFLCCRAWWSRATQLQDFHLLGFIVLVSVKETNPYYQFCLHTTWQNRLSYYDHQWFFLISICLCEWLFHERSYFFHSLPCFVVLATIKWEILQVLSNAFYQNNFIRARAWDSIYRTRVRISPNKILKLSISGVQWSYCYHLNQSCKVHGVVSSEESVLA